MWSNRGSRKWSTTRKRCRITSARLKGPSGQRLHGFDDILQRFLGGIDAELDGFVGAVKIEHAVARQSRCDHRVRRVAGEAGARDAVLDDVEGIDHDRRESRLTGRPEKPSPEQLLGPSTQAVGGRRW